MIDVAKYYPQIYNKILEFKELAKTENALFNDLEVEINKLKNNLFILTCDEATLKKYEILFSISSSKSETLEFRKERILNRINLSMPFTLLGLKAKLNEIIGKDNYTINIDYNNFTIYVESKILNQHWFVETHLTINKMKPANMVFVNKPFSSSLLKINEEVSYSKRINNYKLGKWRLGEMPFVSKTSNEVIKINSDRSIENNMINGLKEKVISMISKARINNSIIIDTFKTKNIVDDFVVIEYKLQSSTVSEVTKVELLDSQDNLLSTIDMYIPVIDDIEIKHKFKIEEGVTLR